MKMIIHEFKNGDKAYRFDGNITIPFEGRRRVLSTAPHNGGLRDDIKTVFNHDGRVGLGVACKMKGDTHREHMINTIKEIGLDVNTTTGMETAAKMEHASVKENSYEDITVTAIATGGLCVNGGRVGDPASFIEKMDVPQEHRIGTINILLYIDAELSPGAMARALVTCTEAKSAAVGELLIGSKYSRGIATGSGTDSTIVVSDLDSKRYLTNAGKHSKLGELIGITVKAAVKEALFFQTYVCPEFQYNAIYRLYRFGLTENDIYHSYLKLEEKPLIGRSEFSECLEKISKSRETLVLSSLIAHIMDQMDWDMISVSDAKKSAQEILNLYAKEKGMDLEFEFTKTLDKDESVSEILSLWQEYIIKLTKMNIEG